MKSPVTSISNACLSGTLRESGTDGVEQKSPRFTPLTAKRASHAATARSHCATSWQPAAVAMPCTRAITGIGSRRRLSIRREHCVKSRWWYASEGRARISRRSCPAQNALPAPARTRTRALASLSSASSSPCSAASSPSDSALKACGRLSVSVMTPRASRSTLTSGSDSRTAAGLLMRGTSLNGARGAGALAQQVLLDLAGRGLRNLLEPHLVRDLGAGEQCPAMRNQLLRRRARAGLQLDVGERRLAPLGVGTSDYGTDSDAGVAIERILDLERAHILAAADDHILAAVLDLGVVVTLEHGEIA